MTIRSTLGRFGIVTVSAIQAINGASTGSSTLAVYVALTTRADRDEEQSWRCSVASIAEEAGVSERSVRNAKLTLVELGLLEVHENWTADGDRGWDSYLVHFTPGAATVAGGEDDVAEGEDDVAGFSSDQLTDQVTENTLVVPSETTTIEEQFNSWYSTYPKKQGKATAFKKFKRLPVAERQGCLDSQPAWNAHWEQEGNQFCPMASTWVSQKRWLDDLPTNTCNGAEQTATQRLREMMNR